MVRISSNIIQQHHFKYIKETVPITKNKRRDKNYIFSILTVLSRKTQPEVCKNSNTVNESECVLLRGYITHVIFHLYHTSPATGARKSIRGNSKKNAYFYSQWCSILTVGRKNITASKTGSFLSQITFT